MIQEKSRFTLVFRILTILLLALLGLSMLLPFVNLIAKSFSSDYAVVSGKVGLLPVGFQADTYRYVLAQEQFRTSFLNSVLLLLVGTLSSLFCTVTTAYPLSRTHLRGRKVFLYLWVFVMLFNGGMIPNYMLFRYLNLTDTFQVLFIPMLVNVFNMLILKNYFEEIPDALEEAAKIDGASNIRILFQIMLPISLPSLATITLFYMVAYWNEYFNAMIYISSPANKPLQLYLYEMIYNAMQVLNEGANAQSVVSIESAMNLTPDSIRAATIVVSTVPILVVYPFLQRFFIKGMVVGSVKG